ncbi:MAG: LptF/LptG family permease, partial [Alphaproteobacteria bacterium]|nr:LptF/LptG family permease [Alphaproteobacteria bacterium]
LSVGELIDPPYELVRAKGPLSRFKSELHSRFATPLLTFSFVLIALAAVLSGSFNRRGMSRRILAAALSIVVVQTGYMTLVGFVARNSGLSFFLYLVAVLPAPFAFAFLSGDYLRSKRWPRRLKLWPKLIRRVFS